MTEWRLVADWPRYEVSSDGNVRNTSTGHILKPGLGSNGYLSVVLCDDDKPKRSMSIHRLVCEAFQGPSPEGCEVAHENGNRLDNSAMNLTWKTRAGNIADTMRHGRVPCGERHWNTTVTEAQVLEIRRRAKRGNHTALAREYGVTRSAIGHIVRGSVWKHLL